MDEPAKYNVWIHIEGVDADGDCIQGDDYFEPHKVGTFNTVEGAESLRYRLFRAAQGRHVQHSRRCRIAALLSGAARQVRRDEA